MIYYDFAKKFSKNPGLRFKKMTPNISGEEFRDNVLEEFFKNDTPVTINVDGVETSLGASFLSESFGNIAVKYGREKFFNIINFDTKSDKGKVTEKEMKKRVEEALRNQKK